MSMTERFDEIAQKTDQARQRLSSPQVGSQMGGQFQQMTTELQQALRDLYEVRDKVNKTIQTTERLAQDVSSGQWQSSQGQSDPEIRSAVAEIATSVGDLAREVKNTVGSKQ